ncbi:MAG: hypothetical protein WCA53_31410 [Caballeronia sp.]
MSVPTKSLAPSPAGLRPASLADTQIDHIERMVHWVLGRNALGTDSCMNPEYWTARVHELMKENNLVAVQQQRIGRLLEQLEFMTQPDAQNHTA